MKREQLRGDATGLKCWDDLHETFREQVRRRFPDILSKDRERLAVYVTEQVTSAIADCVERRPYAGVFNIRVDASSMKRAAQERSLS